MESIFINLKFLLKNAVSDDIVKKRCYAPLVAHGARLSTNLCFDVKTHLIERRFICITLRRMGMSFSYNKLWKILIDRKMKKKDLIRDAGITSTTVAKLGKDLPVSMEVLGKICHALHVNIGDIVDYIDSDK